MPSLADLLTKLLYTASDRGATAFPVAEELYPQDRPYLEQFLGKETLFPQTMRPTQLHVNDRARWFKPDPSNEDVWPGTNFKPSPRFYDRNDPTGRRIQSDEIDQMPVGKVIPLATDRIGGLSGYLGSIGKDKAGPYVSIYDKWDFDSPLVNTLVGRMMDTVGTPFHVYDRKRLDKNSQGDYKYRGDIELPKDK